MAAGPRRRTGECVASGFRSAPGCCRQCERGVCVDVFAAAHARERALQRAWSRTPNAGSRWRKWAA
eukprot:579046-Pyramimonas_sp.AAC.1